MELSTDPDYRNLLGRIRCDSVALIELITCRRVPSLKTAFPDMPQLSPHHLKYMRKFAAAWPDREIMQRTVAQLPWSSKRWRLSGIEISETVSRNSIVSHWPTIILPTSQAFVALELIETLFTRFTLGCSYYVTLLSIESNDALVELTLPIGRACKWLKRQYLTATNRPRQG
jgi:hypothetical protein